MNTNNCEAKDFCTYPVEMCTRYPQNHTNGCDPYIQDNPKRRKTPACFFHVVHEDTSDAADFTIGDFVDCFTKHKDSYVAKFKKGN